MSLNNEWQVIKTGNDSHKLPTLMKDELFLLALMLGGQLGTECVEVASGFGLDINCRCDCVCMCV